MKKVDVILGLQWGDEGKGKVVDVLTPHYEVVARFQGGPNAGHTLEFNGEKYVLRSIPSGIFQGGKTNIIGNGVVLDAVLFRAEAEELARSGHDLTRQLCISKKAHLILPTHRILDAAYEAAKGSSKIGTTGKGIGPTYTDKVSRNGMRVGDLLSPDFRAIYARAKARHEQILRSLNYSYDITELEAQWFEAVEYLKRFRIIDSEYEINALLDSLTEIIKLSKSGAELRERYYKAIIDRVNAGIIAIDSNGNVRICNDNALKMLGMKYAANTAAINRSLPGFDNIIADSTVAGTTIVGCGKDKNLSVSVSGFVHDGNTTTVCVLTDIHNALSHKEVDAWINLTRVLTHEIMNSIAPINALSDSLLPTASGTMKEKIEVIRDTSASLMAFTETFRKFSAIPKPQRQLVYVADLISEATTLLSESIANASVKIHTENDLIVNADRTLMVRALVNLLHNAVDAGATKIDICSRSCSDDSVVIDISDNGSPIPEECRDRIFVPFFTTKQNGSGIGLAVARRVLSLHDGGISLIQPTDAPYTKTFRMSLL